LPFFFAGAVAANGIPHFVKGIIGSRHKTPFKNPSSAPANALWGGANFFIGFWVGVRAMTFRVPFPVAGTLVIAGMLLTGYLLVCHWHNDPVAKGEKE
jgi:hypothetical protein